MNSIVFMLLAALALVITLDLCWHKLGHVTKTIVIVTLFAIVAMNFLACAPVKGFRYGNNCQQKLSSAGMDQDASAYRCRARGRR